MDLLTMAGALAIVVIAFAVADYIEAKAKALRPTLPSNPPSDEGTKE